MIKITALNKFYKSKRRSICHALKNISLTLPDAGLVFVLGKSGSGKSTLLNLIGGLDNISSGSIEVDGNDLATFREKDFCNYRNTHIGFIFQDYHLIDELTVYENIVLSLNLRRIEDRDLVKAALAKVDLAGYEDRYPTELSGGEQQRVAIARAIVKNPRIILADEPTGNLDTHTSTAIITLLKQLSKECLILIVSHNVNDANNYADRVIELKNGEIISDKSRNPDFADCVTLQEGNLVYPKDTFLSDCDIELMNNNKSAKIIKRTDKFITTPENKDKTANIEIERKSLSLGKKLSLTGKFLKNKTLAISLSAFMVAVIMTILALAQTISAFDGGKIVAEEMEKSNQPSILANKILDEQIQNALDEKYHVKVDEMDIQSFYDAGYKGNIYPVYSLTIPIVTSYNIRGRNKTIFSNTPYINETLGVMCVDEDFLVRKFGEVKYHVCRSEFLDQGVIITDYVADAIILTGIATSGQKATSYDELLNLGRHVSAWDDDSLIINGIIDTGYKEKYKHLIDKYGSDFASAKISNNPDFMEFVNDVYDRLGYLYSLNPDFLSDYIENKYWMYPTFYTLSFNETEYITNYNLYIKENKNNGSQIFEAQDGWRYTTTPPLIPDGAKYIRIARNTKYQTAGSSVLKFSDGKDIDENTLNFEIGKGISKNGQIVNRSNSCLSDYIPIPDGATITEFESLVPVNFAYCAFYDADKRLISTENANNIIIDTPKTVVIPYVIYNLIFETKYDLTNLDSFVPHTVDLSHYFYYDMDKENPLFSEEVTISQIYNGSYMLLSDDMYDLFYKDAIFVNALYFDGTDGIGAVLNNAEALNYEYQSYSIEGIHSMTRAVDVFVPIFEFISIFLYIGVIFILMNFATKTINDKMHEIGILKAIGTKNGTIGVVFGLQVMLIALLTCLLSTLGYYLFIDTANDILIESVHRIAPSWNLPELQFLVFEWEIALMNCALTLGLAILSLIAPMIKIKAIKPVKIIKAKE